MQSFWDVKQFGFECRDTYRSERMSICLKRSLGSCCRLLFERDLKEAQREDLPLCCDLRGTILFMCDLKRKDSTEYLQVGQRLESSERVLGERLDVVILDEPEEKTKPPDC